MGPVGLEGLGGGGVGAAGVKAMVSSYSASFTGPFPPLTPLNDKRPADTKGKVSTQK